MGMPAKSLPKKLRQAMGITLGPGGQALPPCGPPLVGHVLLELAIDPPTVTHHDKEIAVRDGHRTLVDSEALKAARRLYELAIPQRPGATPAPLQGPVVLRTTFAFRSERADADYWHQGKPDLDNAVKLLKDVLAARRYVADDKHVSLEVLAKCWRPVASVRVYMRSLLGPDDVGAEFPVECVGRVEPLPQQAAWDVAPSAMAAIAGERPIGAKPARQGRGQRAEGRGQRAEEG